MGRPSRRVVNPDSDIAVTISWDRAGLPRLWQWIHRRAGIYALGIEPANCSVLGRGGGPRGRAASHARAGRRARHPAVDRGGAV